MATADEILATMAEEAAATDQMAEVCTIDRCTRAVTIPEALRIVGVETDKDVTRRVFRVLCSYRGTNLSTFRIRIHFMNANKERDIYYVTDAAQDGEYLTFSWVISRNATKYKGKLQFIACMVCDGGTDEEREWNSTLGEFTVLEGLEVELTEGEEEQARDAITQLLDVIDARESEAVEAVSAQGTTQVAAVRAAGAQQEARIAAKGAATLETIPDDYATLHNNVAALSEDIARNTTPPIVPTATGSIVTITDGAARPAVELISHIEPVQAGSGDPSPDNVRPISGWDSVTAQRTGKNLLPEFVSGYWEVEGAATVIEHANWMRSPDLIAIKPNTTYTLSRSDGVTPPINGYICLYDKNKMVVRYFQDQTFTTTASEVYFAAYTQTGYYSPLQLESSPVPTAHASYQGKTLSADLPETVYGGDVYWHTGKMIITEIKRKIGRSYSMGLYATNIHGLPIYRIILDKATANNYYGIANWLPHNYSYDSDYECFFVSGSSLYVTIDPNRLATNDAEGFAAYLDAHPLEIVYELAAPEEIKLTPQQLDTLKGTNNVWSNCGDTTLSYIADTKLYIDQKLAAIAAATL